MKNQIRVTLAIAVATAPCAFAQKGTLRFGESKAVRTERNDSPPPRVWQDPHYVNPFTNIPPMSSGQVYVYDQKQYGGGHVILTAQEAQSIIDRFKAAYPGLGNPRFLIYVNRDLVDERSGLKLTRREETIKASRTNGPNSQYTVSSTSRNTYMSDAKTPPSLADKQTVRDVERLFGRPLRSAGAALADQRVASQLIAERSLSDVIGSPENPQARRDRDALTQVADAVIEVLISSRTINVSGITQDRTIAVPDIQATAIRLKDSKILGQASSSDVTDRVPPAALAGFDVGQVTEATALALMEDMIPAE